MPYKIEHVIGKDGLHRIRLTGENGEIFDNSHEGFSSKSEAFANLILKFGFLLACAGASGAVNNAYCVDLRLAINRGNVPTLDERDPAPSNPIPCSIPGLAIDLIARDPLEPQQ